MLRYVELQPFGSRSGCFAIADRGHHIEPCKQLRLLRVKRHIVKRAFCGDGNRAGATCNLGFQNRGAAIIMQHCPLCQGRNSETRPRGSGFKEKAGNPPAGRTQFHGVQQVISCQGQRTEFAFKDLAVAIPGI